MWCSFAIELRSRPQPVLAERTLQEDPAVHAQPTAQVKQAKAKLKKQLRSQSDPASNGSRRSPPRRGLSWPGLPALAALSRGGGENGESTFPGPRRERKFGMSLARGWIKLRGVFRALIVFRSLKKNIRRRKRGNTPENTPES